MTAFREQPFGIDLSSSARLDEHATMIETFRKASTIRKQLDLTSGLVERLGSVHAPISVIFRAWTVVLHGPNSHSAERRNDTVLPSSLGQMYTVRSKPPSFYTGPGFL
jgi:hypothetical protein